MTSIEGRRKTLFGTTGMQLLDISNRPDREIAFTYTNHGKDVLPWIEKYTHGDFYLSDFTIGFTDPNDLLIFKLAFTR